MNEVLQLRGVESIDGSEIAPVGSFTVRRALPGRKRHAIGPWVFLDHFGPTPITPGEDGVGAHPHAGIETVTLILSGRMAHRDSAGHEGTVGPGGVQWMTSGRGIVHAEKPLAENAAEESLHGIQLWTTLPRALKLMAPRYQRIDAASIPAFEREGASVRVIAGEYADMKGPAETLMPLFLWHVKLAPGARFEALLPGTHEAGAYVIAGEGSFGADAGDRAGLGEFVAWDNAAGAIRVANAGARELEVLLLGGAPAEGPLVFHGPFVMNSVEQVRAAEAAFRTGRMGALS